MSLTSRALKRAHFPQSTAQIHQTQVRHATLLKRPHIPYTFTQLITLSDGSTYTARTTSPRPVWKSTKDTRNHPLWQPSLDSLRNVEQDDAGRLRAFRERFGRGWDLDSQREGEVGSEESLLERADGEEESLMDLISGAGWMEGRQAGGKKGNEAGEGEEGAQKMVKVMKDGKLMSVPAQDRSERRK